MEEAKHSYKGLCKGFLIGGFLGATAGILFAPKSGKELRSNIMGKGENVLKSTKQFYSGTKAKADAVFRGTGGRFLGRWGRKEKMSFHDVEEPEEVVGQA